MLGLLEKPLVRLPAYALFGLVVFAVAAAATFPDDQIKDIAKVQIEKALDNKYRVDIADLDLWWLTGVSLEGVTIEERVDPSAAKAPRLPEEGEEGLPEDLPTKLTIPRVSGRLAVLRSLVGGPTVEFEADVGGGTIEGSFQQGSSERTVRVEFDDLDLRKTTALTAFLGVPFFGDLSGDIDLVLDAKKPMLTGGTVSIKGDKLTVGPATIKTDKFPPITYLEVPQTNFGTLNIELAAAQPEQKAAKGDKGAPATPTLAIEKFEASGRDIRGEGWGDFKLASRLDATQADVEMRLQFDQNFVKKNSLGPLLNVAEVRKGKNRDWFGFHIYGRLKKIQFKGSPKAAGGPSGAKADKAEVKEK